MKFSLEVLVWFLAGIALMLALGGRVRSPWLAVGVLLMLGWKTTRLAYGLDEPSCAGCMAASGLPADLADIGFALVGAAIGWAIADGVLRCPPFGFPSAALPAFGLAFVWVSGYGYRYNLSALNASSFSVFAFVFWGLGLCLVIATSRRLEALGLSRRRGLLVLCLIYWLALMALEHVGYQWLGVREMSRGVFHSALFLGLVHGPWYMKLYYLTAGPVLALLDQAWRHHGAGWVHRLAPGMFRSA